MRKTWMIITSVMILAGAAGAAVQAGGAAVDKILIIADVHKDGGQSLRHFRIHPATGNLERIDWAAGEWVDPDNARLQQAVVTYSYHWNFPSLIKYKVTKDAKPLKGKIQKIINKYLNRRRGVNSVPRMKVTVNIIPVTPITAFANPADFYNQLRDDNQISVVVTADDQFFKDPNGNLFDPEVISTTHIIATAYLTPDGRDYTGIYWINEADVYLRSDFFSFPAATCNRIGAAAFRLALGYRQTTWSHDHLAREPRHVTSAAFKNAGSGVWTLISEVRDRFFYGDRLGKTWTPDFLSVPRMLPHEDEVINLGDYALPEINPNGQVDLGRNAILFLSNLKAYSGAKKLIVKIFRVTDTDPSRDVRIVTLRGNPLRYPVPVMGGGDFYPGMFLQQIRLGRQADLNKLTGAVAAHGVMKTLDGVMFQKALRIKVRVTGRLEENGKKKTITRLFWLVDVTD